MHTQTISKTTVGGGSTATYAHKAELVARIANMLEYVTIHGTPYSHQHTRPTVPGAYQITQKRQDAINSLKTISGQILTNPDMPDAATLAAIRAHVETLVPNQLTNPHILNLVALQTPINLYIKQNF